jgi:GNAT superfamily N-acetyltransferase
MSEKITYRRLEAIDVDKFRGIDRSEYIDAIYYFREGELVLEPEVYNMKGFPPGELEKIIEETRELIERGGTVYGAFMGDTLVGASSVECDFIGSSRDTLQMPILHISKSYRGLGVGQTLMKLVIERARELGARKLYVSATPSRHTVHFYQRIGCVLASEIDPVLFAKEPEDIHLELVL